MNWFMHRVIGGNTGTRQGAWFAFLVQLGFLAWGVSLLTRGHEMQPLFALLTVTLTVTVPGAGMITIEENEVAMQFLEACRSR